MSKPKIYGTCPAGCLWETVHKEDFEKSASLIKQYPDADGRYYLEKGKEYKIICAKTATEDGSYSFGSVRFYTGNRSTAYALTTTDKYADYIVFRFLDSYTAEDGLLHLVYEVAGVRYDAMSDSLIASSTAGAYISAADGLTVFLYNADATIKAEKGEQGEKGEAGKDGKDGADGVSVPAGGTAGQFLKKKSDTDFDFEWAQVEGGEDKTKSRFTFNIPESALYLDIRGIYNYCTGYTFIDWGDGTATEIVNDDSFKHTYAEAGVYTVTITGLTTIGKLSLRAHPYLTKAVISSIVTSIGASAFDECPLLSEVVIYAETPPTVETNSFNDTVAKIYVHNSAYLTASNWSKYADRLYFDFSQGGGGVTEELQGQVDQNTADISMLKASGGAENHADTKVTLTVTDGYSLDIRVLYNLENHGGCTSIDWGDGTVTEILGVTDEEMRHSYATAGTYTVTLVGVKVLPRAFVDKKVSYVVIGSTLETIDDSAFYENPDLTEVRIYAENPPAFINTITSWDKPFGDIKVIYVPEKSIRKYVEQWSDYASIFQTDSVLTNIFADKVVTVGASGDFPTINKAIEYLSAFYPVYKKGGMKCEIKILDGTVIDEQVIVERLDLSYITITTDNANNTVTVTPTTANWSKSTLTHDTRGNVPFFGGEFGARLPVIKCLFSATSPTVTLDGSAVGIVGYYCNRGSMGVIAGETTYTGSSAEALANIGFEGFYDNIIANNNSEIVLREAIARNAARYGVMSRHISRVSARSADITGCAEAAAYADRASMMDVRHANLSGSKNAIQSYNASVITANETTANNITGLVADAQAGSILNAEQIDAQNSANIFSVAMGGQIVAKSAKTTGATGTLYNVAVNTLTADGIIFN